MSAIKIFFASFIFTVVFVVTVNDPFWINIAVYILLVTIVYLICRFLYRHFSISKQVDRAISKRKNERDDDEYDDDEEEYEEGESRWISTYPKTHVPKGYQLWKKDISVVGIKYHLKNFIEFFENGGGALDIIHEDDNPYDSNAIGFYTKEKKLIGYIPKEISAYIIQHDLLDKLKFRIQWIGLLKNKQAGGIRFDIMLPKEIVKQHLK